MRRWCFIQRPKLQVFTCNIVEQSPLGDPNIGAPGGRQRPARVCQGAMGAMALWTIWNGRWVLDVLDGGN